MDDSKWRGNIACSCRVRYLNPEIIQGNWTFLYNFEAGAPQKAGLVSLLGDARQGKRNFRHDSFPFISSMLLIYWYHAVWRTQRLNEMAWNPKCRVMQVGGSGSSSASIASLFLATTQSISAQKTHSSSTNRFLVPENVHTYTNNLQSTFDLLA